MLTYKKTRRCVTSITYAACRTVIFSKRLSKKKKVGDGSHLACSNDGEGTELITWTALNDSSVKCLSGTVGNVGQPRKL